MFSSSEHLDLHSKIILLCHTVEKREMIFFSLSSFLSSFLNSCYFYTFWFGAQGIKGRPNDQENPYWTGPVVSRFYSLHLEVVWRGFSPVCTLVGFLKPSSLFFNPSFHSSVGTSDCGSSLFWPLSPFVAFQNSEVELQLFSS